MFSSNIQDGWTSILGTSSSENPSEPSINQPQPAPEQPGLDPIPPLLSDEERRDNLYHRYLLLNLGGNDGLEPMSNILNAQIAVEKSIEEALVEDGFQPQSILQKYPQLRGLIHSPQGQLLRERTYRSYMAQIQENGTRESVPYRRIMQAIRNFDLFLER